jgi:tRNA pseudouridine55 synthase
MDGILNINKPAGKTSYTIVAMVKRLTGEKRVGHAGTLDPLATGVLPVCLGQATRLVEYLVDTTKKSSSVSPPTVMIWKARSLNGVTPLPYP